MHANNQLKIQNSCLEALGLRRKIMFFFKNKFGFLSPKPCLCHGEISQRLSLHSEKRSEVFGFFFFFFLFTKRTENSFEIISGLKTKTFFLTFYFYNIYGCAKNQLQILKSLFKGPKPCVLSVVGLKWVQEENFDCSLKPIHFSSTKPSLDH